MLIRMNGEDSFIDYREMAPGAADPRNRGRSVVIEAEAEAAN